METTVTVRDLLRSDFAPAMHWAAEGMHLARYVGDGLLLRLYARAFFYEELGRATQALAAEVDGRCAGVLLAEIDGEERAAPSVARSLYVRAFNALQRLYAGAGVDAYDEANKSMLASYRAAFEPDGEIVFLATDPQSRVRGIGTALLRELERREPGKRVHLFTDDACTYQFYERRGFERVGERAVSVEVRERKAPLGCFLYSKVLGAPSASSTSPM